MSRFTAICLALSIVAAAQGAEEPAASSHRREAAVKALARGDAGEAERLLKENVVAAEKIDPDGLQLADPLERLAVFYADSDRKRFDDALPLIRRALAIREQWQGCEDADVGETLNLLAMVLIMTKRDDPLIMPLLERARIVLENGRGKDDPCVADVLHTMAFRQMSSGEYATAEANMEQALAIREKAFGPFSNKLANIVDDLGDLHFGQIHQFELNDRETEAGKKPPEENDSEKHARLAHDYYSRALAIREKIDKPDDDHIGGSLYNLGQLAWARGRLEEMERYLTRWLDWDRAADGRGEIKIRARVLLMLSCAAAERKDYVDAERLLARSQEVVERLYGRQSAEAEFNRTARIGNALAAGRFDEAGRFLGEAFEILSQSFCLDDPEVKAVRAFLADSYINHIDDPLGPILWHRIDAFADELSPEHDRLREILTTHADLLRLTSRAAPKITAEDRADLKTRKKLPFFWDLGESGRLRRIEQDAIAPSDEVLSHMARLYDLESLELRSAVTDAGMVYLKGLLNLETLTYSGNQITDAGMAHLRGLTNLKQLTLSGIGITDEGIAHLQGLTNLEQLSLSGIGITGAGMVHLRGLTNLKQLTLSGSQITDAGLVHLRGLTNLKDLSLSGRRITSAGIAELTTLVNLESLNLAYTQVDDEALGLLTALPNLRELNLEHTNVTDAGLLRLRTFRNLETVDVQYSRVTRPATLKFREQWPGLRLKFQLTGPVD